MLAEGPLAGVRVLEMAGLGPTPFAGMMLAELGADVVRIDRPAGVRQIQIDPAVDLLSRGKRSIVLDLRSQADVLLDLAGRADVLIEGHRPGVMERLGVGPEDCWRRNPRLVYGRMTGWGQDGPLARTAGHDLNFIAVTGALHSIGDAGRPPQIPINYVGDFGGGATYLVIGVLAALRSAERSGVGEVVDAAIVDGVSHLMAWTHYKLSAGEWSEERGTNLIDGGAPFYRVYETADHRHVAVGAMEPQFYADLLRLLGLDEEPARQRDAGDWPTMHDRFAAAFARRTQAEWMDIFAGTDACVSPVLGMRAALDHPQIRARGTIVETDGVVHAAAAPRFSRSATTARGPGPHPGEHTDEVLDEWMSARV